MHERGLIQAAEMRATYDRLAPLLYRSPAIDPAACRSAVHSAFADA